MIHNWRFTDWLYRPRTPEEITPGFGNGILWRQGPHQFDIIRTIGGGRVRSLRATTQVFDPARRVAGAFTAFLEFEDGCCATVVQSGYDHFSSRSLVFGFDGANALEDAGRYGRARRKLREQPDSAAWELSAAAAERYGGGRRKAPADGARPGNRMAGSWEAHWWRALSAGTFACRRKASSSTATRSKGKSPSIRDGTDVTAGCAISTRPSRCSGR